MTLQLTPSRVSDSNLPLRRLQSVLDPRNVAVGGKTAVRHLMKHTGFVLRCSAYAADVNAIRCRCLHRNFSVVSAASREVAIPKPQTILETRPDLTHH